jgi:hypothetical protein
VTAPRDFDAPTAYDGPPMSDASRPTPKNVTPSVSLRALFRLHVAANKPLELDFPSGKVVMSVAEMKAALKDDEDQQARRPPAPAPSADKRAC